MCGPCPFWGEASMPALGDALSTRSHPCPTAACFTFAGSVMLNLSKHLAPSRGAVLPPQEQCSSCESRGEGLQCCSGGVRVGDSRTGGEPLTWEVGDRTTGIRLRLARESSVPISPSM